MTLQFREPPRNPTLNCVLYGPPGVGKTTGALTAPGPVLYLNCEGPNAAMYARRTMPQDHILEVELTDMNVMAEAIEYVKAGKVRTVVLDSAGAAFATLLEVAAHGGKPTLPQYGDVTTAIERFCRVMRDLPVNFITLAHEHTVKDEESGVLERLPFTGTSNPHLGVKLLAQVDVVGYCGRSQKDGEQPVYLAQLFNGGGRRGKDRTGLLGNSQPLNLTAWLDTYNQALTAPATPPVAEKELVAA